MEKSDVIWMDGALVPWDAAQVHVLTHTLHYGLGVFEGIRCYRGGDGRSAVFRLPEHVRRLFDSCHVLGFEPPFSRDEIQAACLDVVRRNRLDECYLRPLVFLGDGEMGLSAKNPVRVAVAALRWGSYLGDEGVANGIRVKTSSFARFHPNTFLGKAKAVGNYVNSILAAREARVAGYHEALMLDVDGYVAEASGENLFVLRDGVVRTPSTTSILPGITRDAVIRLLADEGIVVREDRLTRDEVYLADEAFFTGTAAEVTPVRELDDRRIGDGRPGPVTRRVQELYSRAVRGGLELHREWLTFV